ncbi:MAG: Uma2 family endonuclease [Gemmataceae bacterium]|nr:Uma2 family endonuclease [Gemmataceae bacterium]
MPLAFAPEKLDEVLPDHTQLPDHDEVPMNNFLEPWQSALLTNTLLPRLYELYPEGDFAIGQNSGIYFERTDPPNLGCRAPDWFLVLEVPKLLGGILRRSYVLWQELTAPLILLEYASDSGDEERDQTPKTGKFWIYERRIRPAYYGIFLHTGAKLEMYQLVGNRFAALTPNAAGRFPIEPLGVELGVWKGTFGQYETDWLRWWTNTGLLLPTGDERAEQERQRAEQERQRAEQERRRAEALAAKLQQLGIDPQSIDHC